MDELWQPIDGYLGLYEVSNLGRVRSLDREVATRGRSKEMRTRRLKGRILRQGQVRGRYFVNLSKHDHPWVVPVHCLVARAFLGPKPKGLEIDHVNGDFQDNRAENLEYVTHQENQKRAYDLGKLKPPKNDRDPITGKWCSARSVP